VNELEWSLRVTSAEQAAARVSSRRHQFIVGSPLTFDAEHPFLSALEHVLGALGAEILTGLQEFARRRRFDIDQIEVVVHGYLENPLAYLEVVGEPERTRLARVRVKVFVQSPGDEPGFARLWRETLHRLPLVTTLAPALDLTLEYAWNP